MQSSNELFPYPILQEEAIDYKKSTFNLAMSCSHYENNLLINFEIDNTSELISKYIAEGKMTYCIRVECSLTGFRKDYLNSDNKFKICIDSNQIENLIKIRPMIVAKENIDGFSSDEFIDDYKGIAFHFHVGTIIGQTARKEIIISKKFDDLTKLSSIIKVVRTEDVSKELMECDTTNNATIRIILPAEQYNQYCRLGNRSYCDLAVFSMIIVPALSEVFSRIQNGDEEEYADTQWYQALITKLKEENIIKQDSDIKKHVALELAQLVLKNPIERGLKVLDEGGYNEN